MWQYYPQTARVASNGDVALEGELREQVRTLPNRFTTFRKLRRYVVGDREAMLAQIDAHSSQKIKARKNTPPSAVMFSLEFNKTPLRGWALVPSSFRAPDARPEDLPESFLDSRVARDSTSPQWKIEFPYQVSDGSTVSVRPLVWANDSAVWWAWPTRAVLLIPAVAIDIVTAPFLLLILFFGKM